MSLPDFANEPLAELSEPDQRRAFKAALARVENELGREYPLIIGGDRIATGEWIESIDPSQHDRVVGRVAKANATMAERALDAAERDFQEWSRLPGRERAVVGLRAAAAMRRRKH